MILSKNVFLKVILLLTLIAATSRSTGIQGGPKGADRNSPAADRSARADPTSGGRTSNNRRSTPPKAAAALSPAHRRHWAGRVCCSTSAAWPPAWQRGTPPATDPVGPEPPPGPPSTCAKISRTCGSWPPQPPAG